MLCIPQEQPFPLKLANRGRAMEKDVATIRAQAEETHHDRLMKELAGPTTFFIESITPGAEVIDIRKPNSTERSKRTLAELTAEDIRGFSWKDCALYLTSNVRSLDHMRIFDSIYREWFPCRAKAQDIGLGSFFCKTMRFASRQSIGQVTEFHRRLCKEIQKNQSDVAIQSRGQYDMRSTLYDAFVVLDVDWRTSGVTVLCENAGIAAQLGLKENEALRDDNLGQMDGALAFKVPLKKAMHVIISRDKLRNTAQNEDSDYYKARCEFYTQLYGTADI